ncbi:hypothetical protein HPP92_017186 [Vanilla planifolia]|uniref:Uncharacterized protein n=1 Tax=Vanilla planifolia TaxID=51239 RepID=A0A835UNC7_VANPL|nr:hypothetical protein HPP92_017186 [Vanilla planifolia]
MRFFGSLWIAIGNMKNLLIAINYFAMWLEMKPMLDGMLLNLSSQSPLLDMENPYPLK